MTEDPAASGPEPYEGFPRREVSPASGRSGPPSGDRSARHPDPDRLADLAEGLLDAGAADEVRTHLTSCERCAEDFALITLDSGLAEFLAPEPIPAEVVARVEAALHREPPLGVAGPAAQPTAHHAAKPSRARRFKLAFGGVASVGLLIGGVFAGISVLNSGSETAMKSATSTGPDRVGAETANGSSGSVGAQPSAGEVPSAASPPAASANIDIARQATRLLTTLKAGSSTAAATRPGGTGLKTPTTPDAVNSCWHNPTTGETLLTSAPITYQGRAAELLVYSKAGDPAKADVVVISPACTTPTKAGAPVTSYSLLSPMVLAETEITRP